MSSDSTEPTLANPVLATLSPSRASDFKRCPQLYKFKSIDKLRTEPTVHQARGTAVHLALERLFEGEKHTRTPENLYDLFRGAWSELRTTEYPGLFDSVEEERDWGINCLHMLADYFSIEDPTSFDPVASEKDMLVDVGHMKIRGILDRMEEITEVGPEGSETRATVITDYKTGKAPRPQYQNEAFFALKIYALMIRTTQGVAPDRIRLLYLNGPTELIRAVTDEQLDAMQAHLSVLWAAIEEAITSGNWPARTSPLCNWCDFKDTICPAFEHERSESDG